MCMRGAQCQRQLLQSARTPKPLPRAARLPPDDSGVERLIVTAEDGARLDRRYTYKAAEDAGGFCFENGKAVCAALAGAVL